MDWLKEHSTSFGVKDDDDDDVFKCFIKPAVKNTFLFSMMTHNTTSNR